MRPNAKEQANHRHPVVAGCILRPVPFESCCLFGANPQPIEPKLGERTFHLASLNNNFSWPLDKKGIKLTLLVDWRFQTHLD